MEQATAGHSARQQQPETIRIKGFVVYDSCLGYRHTPWDPRIGDNTLGLIVVGEHEIEFAIPAGFNPVAAEVQALQAQVESEGRKFAHRVAELNDRIAKLQCIEMAPAGAAS